MKKMSDVFKSIRFAKLDPKHEIPEKGGSKDDEEHYTVGEKEYEQQVKHVKKRAMQEQKKDKYDEGEYDREGDMAKSDLRSIIANAKRLHDMIEDSANLPEWVQSKITVAEDYISTVANYMTSEMNEAFKMPPESVAEKMARKQSELRKKSGLPDPSHYLKVAAQKKKEIEDMKKEEVKSYVPSSHGTPVPKKPKGDYERKVDKYLKKKYNKEEVELQEGRPSQRHPLEGHEYHKKSNEELIGIAKDAHAAEAMKGHSTRAENKYRDQANDSATVRYFRQKSGMPDWYKKKYGHVKEDVELDEVAKWRKTSVAKINPAHDPEDWASGRSYDYYHDNPRSTGNLKATSDTDSKYHSLDRRPKAEIASQGSRKGMITKQHTQRLKDRIKSSLRKEENELEEGLQQTLRKVVPGYAKKQINDKMDREKFGRRDVDKDENYHRYKKIMDKLKKEEVENLEEKNVPTSPEKWAQAKAQAKAKFDVYPCVPLDSQAISRNGPISYEDLNIGDEILTYNMKTDELEWKPVLHKHFYEEAPLMEIGKPTGFSIRCTPNHKWVVSRSDKKELVETKDLNTHMKIHMCSVLNNQSSLILENWSKKDNWIENVINMDKNQREIYLASSVVYDGWDKGVSSKIKDRHTFGFVQKEYDHLWSSLLAAYLNGYYVNTSERSGDMTGATYIRNKTFHSTQNLYKKDSGSEDVWCPTTENETWVMIQNGLITITGNSAYANGWAAKKYKSMGGGWKSVSEESILESRKAEIIKKIVKGKKTNSDDKFEPNPVMSKDEDKGRDNINNK